jgi:5-methylcytosine-specific restriction endonuclease McrA
VSVRRGCTNGNARGGSQDRARRRRWLIDTFGDGTTAPCALATPACTGPVTIDTVTADRIIPGCNGGTYRRDNIRPACQPCQSRQGGQLGAQRARQNEAVRRARHQTHS